MVKPIDDEDRKFKRKRIKELIITECRDLLKALENKTFERDG